MGKKPLYYWQGAGRFVFGSEIKAVLADPGVPREFEDGAIAAYMTFGYVPTPRTFFAGIRSVPPGHVLTVEPGGGPVVDRSWESPVVRNGLSRLERPLEDASREVRSLLRDAVARRLIPVVPLGAFLSGGIDSSAIGGLMASLMDQPVETFTIGFEDRDRYDKRSFAAAVAKRHRTNHHEFVVHPDAVDLVEKLVRHHDQPFGDSSAIPTYLLSEVTAGHATVALSGDGGDELFPGYERFAAGLAARRYDVLPQRVHSAVNGGLGMLPPSAFGAKAQRMQRFGSVASRGLPDAYRCWISFIPE